MARSRAALDKATPGVLTKLAERLPAMPIESSRKLWNDLDRQIGEIKRRLQSWMKEDMTCKAIAAIPGVDVLTATTIVATMGVQVSTRVRRVARTRPQTRWPLAARSSF
jgi:transposase